MSVVMRVQPDGTRQGPGALAALESVLQSIESVRNARAAYLLLLAFSGGGLLMSFARQALAREATLPAGLWMAGAFFALFYASNAAGLVLMDEARGRPPRQPLQALGDALRRGHRLLVVVATVLLAAVALVAAALGLLLAARLPGVGPMALTVVVPLVVPALGLAAVVLLMLIGPVAAPAVWDGLGVRAALALLWHQLRRHFVRALMLSAAVSVLTAAVAGLVSALVLAGGRALLALAVLVLGLDLAPGPFLATLFGQGFSLAPGAPAPSALTGAALDGAALVFALGLVLPGVVYLRGLCELYLALRRSDGAPPPPP
jgi:hypothetical protein